MREDICSIPVNDVFMPKDGCPFCRMRDMLEDRMATYITGAAMMEPDVRVETNRLGFCTEHFNQILARGSRLSVALILESLLATVKDEVFPQGKTAPKKVVAAVKSRQQHCFICENIEKNTAHLLDSTLKLWQTDPDFRELYSQQPYICLRPGDGGGHEDAQKELPGVPAGNGPAGQKVPGRVKRRRDPLLPDVRLPQCRRRLGQLQGCH